MEPFVQVANRPSTRAQLRKLHPPFVYLNVTLAATTIGLRLGLRQLLLPRWTTTKSANAREMLDAIFGLHGETAFPCSFNTTPSAIVTIFLIDHIHVPPSVMVETGEPPRVGKLLWLRRPRASTEPSEKIPFPHNSGVNVALDLRDITHWCKIIENLSRNKILRGRRGLSSASRFSIARLLTARS